MSILRHTLALLILLAGPAAFAQSMTEAQKSEMRSLREQQTAIWRKIRAGEVVENDRRALLRAIDEYNLNFPNDTAGLTFAAEIAAALGDDDLVDTYYSNILGTNPQLVRQGLAWAAYYYDSNPARAEQILLRLGSNAPDNLAFSMAMYEFYTKKMPDRLDRQFEGLIEHPPTRELVGFINGVSATSRDLGLHYARKAKQRWPEDPIATAQLASRLRWVARYQDAIDQFVQLDEPLLLRDDIGMEYADCLYAVHRFTDSIEHLQAIELQDSIYDKRASRGINFRLGTRPRMIQAWKDEQVLRQSDAARDDNPRATIVVDGAPIRVELFEDQAPVSVANFIHLADEGFYRDSDFHRVETGLISQGGRRAGDSDPYGGPGYFIEHEGRRGDARGHFRGSLCMASTGQDQRIGSQFYITHFPTAHLDGTHVVIGRVLEGQERIESMRGGERINDVTITRRREHDYPMDVELEDGTTVPRSVWRAMQQAGDQSSDEP